MVLYHAGIYFSIDPRYWRVPIYDRIFWGGHFGVSFFFVLSGAVILLAHWKDQGKATGAQAIRLEAVPSHLSCVLGCAYPHASAISGPSELGHRHYGGSLVLPSSVALLYIHTDKTVIPVAWSLYCEILFYLTFALVIVRKRLGYVVLALWWIGSLSTLALPVSINIWHYFLPLQALFPLGMLVTVAYRKNLIRNERSLIALGVAGLVASIYFRRQVATSASDLFAGTACAVLIPALMNLERKGHFIVSRFWLLLGDASYAIYLVHMTVLTILIREFHQRAPQGPLFPLFCLSVLGAVGAGILFHLLVERPLLQFTGRTITLGTRPLIKEEA